MIRNTKEKKELGSWGEKVLDSWMKTNNWNPVNKNMRIRRGEIDRVYFNKNNHNGKINFCITEVKTTLFYNIKDIEILFTETGVKRFLKQNQIRNLYRYGENLIAILKQNKTTHFKIYIRFFIVFKIVSRLKNFLLKEIPKSPAIKRCFSNENVIIFSVEPEFTAINSRKSLLQIKI